MADPTSDLFIDFGDFQNAAEPETISPGILQTSTAPPKIGNRFSSESVKILRNWFAAHERHPYPTIQDVQDLQEQTSHELVCECEEESKGSFLAADIAHVSE
ncbi:hypothetical protein J7337_009223 [Fusarium musae]|uniref:Homeobox KN domain-containing protein n=1 Tax=Fusarium musae TaxID=1042133 RepID=A0A9P8DAQ6_9HYPO|nr:hypothetical protein J7337_009223 [Fusarium musae]KAG9498418.1 hypothetical protein J7337_009223 [Fusarium musae]